MNPYLAKLQALEQTGPIGGIVSFVGSQNRPISEFENSKDATSADRQKPTKPLLASIRGARAPVSGLYRYRRLEIGSRRRSRFLDELGRAGRGARLDSARPLRAD